MTNDGTIPEMLTFDDVMLLPGRSSVLPRDVNLTMRLTRDLTMNIPLLSAAMDTVTEARLAIAPAQKGGVGAGMGYCECRTLPELRENARFCRITSAGLRESHVHSIEVTQEAPNYRRE